MKKKILSVAVNVFCVAAILFSLLAGWTVISTPRGKAPTLFGFSFMTVLSGSMEPTIPEGSLVVVQTASPSDIAKEDIITFYAQLGGQDGVINTHRVVEVEQGNAPAFRTQGDANSSPDPSLVTGENLIGRVVFHSLAIGRIVSFLCKPYVFLPMVLIPLLIIIITYTRRIFRLAKQEVREAAKELEEEEPDEK